MAAKHSLLVTLSTEDQVLLSRIAGHVGAAKTEVVRWAIRHYALNGGWIEGDATARREALGLSKPLITGPGWEKESA